MKKERSLLLVNKLMKNVPDLCNAKEHYKLFLRKKNRKSVKQSKIITYEPKTFDTVDIKSDITEHPKTSHKLFKTIRKGEKVDSSDSLYSNTKTHANFLNEKTKNKKQNKNMLLKAMQVLIM